MIPGLMGAHITGLTNGSSMREIINALGLGSGLKQLLDAGDLASVASGSQTKWLDLSGGGYDFNRGTGSGSDAADPTFNGTPGRQSASEYWSFGGDDYFSYDAANESWMNNLHKDNARFSIVGWVNLPSASGQCIVCTAGIDGIGIQVTLNSGSTELLVAPGAFIGSSSLNAVNVGWAFVALSVDEVGNACRWNVNGNTASGTCTYSSPSASNAGLPMLIGSTDSGDVPLPSGAKMANLLMWEGTALSAASIAAIFTASRGKFGV